MAVGRFQNHNTNDPDAFGKTCCITPDARHTTVGHNDANASYAIRLRCNLHRVLWVLKDPNSHPCEFVQNSKIYKAINQIKTLLILWGIIKYIEKMPGLCNNYYALDDYQCGVSKPRTSANSNIGWRVANNQ